MSEESKLLFANEAFYTAFAASDLPAMLAVWSAEEPLFCLHPGWSLLVGRQPIMESWANIFAAGGPEIRQESAEAWIQEGIGLVFCRERLTGGLMSATNLFRHEEGQWRLFHHHASPTRDIPPPPASEPLH